VRDHVESRRLFVLAQMPTIINEPEWEHIKDCSDCGKAFIVLTAAFGQSRLAEDILPRSVIPLMWLLSLESLQLLTVEVAALLT
jgi:hypothetical protein